MDTQWYIGSPNGVVVCVDDTDGLECSGRLYHAYDKKPVTFTNWDQMIVEVDGLCDRLDFPHASENGRFFKRDNASGSDARSKAGSGGNTPGNIAKKAGKAGKIRLRREGRLVPDAELLEHQGKCGTFIVRVQQRRNRTWQGRLSWKEKNETLCFLSILEMIKMIGSAVGGPAG